MFVCLVYLRKYFYKGLQSGLEVYVLNCVLHSLCRYVGTSGGGALGSPI